MGKGGRVNRLERVLESMDRGGRGKREKEKELFVLVLMMRLNNNLDCF